MTPSCTVDDLKNILENPPKNTVFVDVRTPDEFAKKRIEGFVNIPLGSPKERFDELKADHLYILCLSGGRSQQACDQLADWGFKNITNVEGGLLAWMGKGYAVIS